MLSYQQAFYSLCKQLGKIYSDTEAAAIAHEIMEFVTGKGRLQRLVEKDNHLDERQQSLYDNAIVRLLNGEPLQYITGVQWFFGKPFQVNTSVLIPRPETEELVQWVIDEWQDKNDLTILDIGTGSGCIPISLKLKLPAASIAAIDVSKSALTVALQNAQQHQAEIFFLEMDFLKEDQWEKLGQFDIIASNPPYIPEHELDTLERNVRDFEPEIALFVPDTDALLFYRHIARFAKEHLSPDGAVYCELHRDYAQATQAMFEAMSYKTTLRKDMHGNDRMLRAERQFL